MDHHWSSYHPCTALSELSHRETQECGPPRTSQGAEIFLTHTPRSWQKTPYGRTESSEALPGHNGKQDEESIPLLTPFPKLPHQVSLRHGNLFMAQSRFSDSSRLSESRRINTDSSHWCWAVGTKAFSMGMNVYELCHMTPLLSKYQVQLIFI